MKLRVFVVFIFYSQVKIVLAVSAAWPRFRSCRGEPGQDKRGRNNYPTA